MCIYVNLKTGANWQYSRCTIDYSDAMLHILICDYHVQISISLHYKRLVTDPTALC
jgi:hypothetical protein